MSIAIDAVDWVDGMAIVRVVPRPDIDALDDVGACWVRLQEDPAIHAVAVLSVADHFSVGVTADASNVVTIAPKALGLLKPFGVGLRGDVFDYGLQLVGDADVVLAARDVLFADTSVRRGIPAVHAGRLRGLLPDAEVNRLALLGLPSAMTAPRAANLGLVEEIVELSDMERSLVQRLRRLSGH